MSAQPAIDFIPPVREVRISAIGRQVLVGVGSAIAYLTPDEAADLQAQLMQAEGSARETMLRGAP